MFTIGDTSGLVEAKNDKKKNPIKVIGDIVDDMCVIVLPAILVHGSCSCSRIHTYLYVCHASF